FTGHTFARVWASPEERDALAGDIARDLDLSLTLSHADQSLIAVYGEPCRSVWLTAPVVDEGRMLGYVAACPGPSRTDASQRSFGFFGAVLLLGATLWAASGAIARRLARPLGELARMAQSIGAGDLSARVKLNCIRHGEVGLVAESMNEMAARIEKQMA